MCCTLGRRGRHESLRQKKKHEHKGRKGDNKTCKMKKKGGDSLEIRWLGPEQNSGRWQRSCTWCNVLPYCVMTARRAAQTASHALLRPFHTVAHDHNHQSALWEKNWGLIDTETCSCAGFVVSVSVVQGLVDERGGETCLPGHFTSETDSQGAVELSCSVWGPQGTLSALRMLLTPILSTQLACASLTHAGLLMATAS